MKWETIKENCARAAVTEIRSWTTASGERVLLHFRLILNEEIPPRTETNTSPTWRIQKEL